MARVLTKGPWFAHKQALVLTPWRENFRPLCKTVVEAPIWLQPPGILVELLRPSILKLVGKPQKFDNITLSGTQAKYAKIYILMNVSKPLPQGAWIKIDFTKSFQTIAYEKYT